MIYARVKQVKGRRVVLELDEPVNEKYMNRLARGGANYAKVKWLDNIGITVKQRKLSYALIRDISLYTGDDPTYMKEILRFDYEAKTGEVFHHDSASQSEAKQWIDYLIQFVLEHHIPLAKRYSYLLENNTWFYYCLVYDQCCICRDKRDVAHVEAVGMGRDRNQINHSDYHFMALCRKHHTEQHQMGVKRFIEKYHIIPVRLNKNDLKKLNIQRSDT